MLGFDAMPEPLHVELKRATGDAVALAALLDRDDVKNKSRWRGHVAGLLGNTRDAHAASTLECLALDDDDATVRAMALNALGRLPDARPEQLLVRLLADPSPVVRKEACRVSRARLRLDPGAPLVTALGRLTADASFPTALAAISALAAAGRESTTMELANRTPRLRGLRRAVAWMALRRQR